MGTKRGRRYDAAAPLFDELSTMQSTWLSDALWKQVQASVPVACADVLPLRVAGGRVREVGLIHRDTPH